MKLGDIETHRLTGAEQIAGYIAFAASVKSFASSADEIERIGRQLGKFTNSTPSVQQVSCPLLGAGAGGLRS